MRLNWTLPVAMAVTVWLAVVYIAVRHGLTRGDLPEVARVVTPVAVLLIAGWFSRHDRSPARHGTTCASLFVLPVAFAVAYVVVSELATGRRPALPSGIGYVFDRAYQLLLPPIAVALVPAAIGWWQRRQDRLADLDSAA